MKYFQVLISAENKKQTFVIKNSLIEGKGGFASRDIAKGEAICVMAGQPRSFAEFEKMHSDGDSRISCDQLQIGVRTYIVLEKPFIYFNHSCDPNAGIKGERMLTALRTIKMGEEIFYDYSATEWTVQDYPPYYTDGWPMECKCDSPLCRKQIGCFIYLPESTRQKYISSGIIQDHILERLHEPKETQRCFICEKILKTALA